MSLLKMVVAGEKEMRGREYGARTLRYSREAGRPA